MADNWLNGGSALTALTLFIALISIAFFERRSWQDDLGVTHFFRPPVAPVTNSGLCRLAPTVVDVSQYVGQRLAIMNIPLMASDANDYVGFGGRRNGGFVAVFIRFVIFALYALWVLAIQYASGSCSE